MVYAVDAQYAAHDFNAVTRRNTLFTAITRSRAWVRIVGWGDQVEAIQHEIEEVIEHGYELSFEIPTPEQLATLRHIYRERPREEEETVKRVSESLSAFLEALDRGEIELSDLPSDIQGRLGSLRGAEATDDAEGT